METLHIHVFKTNLGKLCPNCQAALLLDSEPLISEWSVDAEDTDCVLRVVTGTLSSDAIAAMIRNIGFECTEL